MEIWIASTEGWNKKPFKSFPAIEPLLKVIIDHKEEDRETDHWIVFTDEEVATIKKLAAPFFPVHMMEHNFLRAVCSPLEDLFAGDRPYVTYVSPDCNKPVADQKGFRLAIRFNQKF